MSTKSTFQKTSISVPVAVLRKARKTAKKLGHRASFSSYVTLLLERDDQAIAKAAK